MERRDQKQLEEGVRQPGPPSRIIGDITLFDTLGPGGDGPYDMHAQKVYDHAIPRAKEPVPGPGVFIRRTRGGTPVLVVANDHGVWAYVVRGTLTSMHGYGIQFDLGVAHNIKGMHNV